MSSKHDPHVNPPPVYHLTTVDNPWSPFTRYEDWLQFENDHGYKTNSLIARRVFTSDALSDYENSTIINNSYNEIIINDPSNFYRKVLATDYDENGILKDFARLNKETIVE